MSVHREQSHIAGTFDSRQEAVAARGVKAAFDKVNTWFVFETEDGRWALARADVEPTSPTGTHAEVKPKPREVDDPRPNTIRNIPPLGGGL